MPDAGITDAVRDQLFDRLGLLAGLDASLGRLEKWMHPVNTSEVVSSLVHGDEDGSRIGAIELTRVQRGTDTAARMRLWGTITDGGAGTGHTVELFDDAARTSLVATTGAAVDDNSTGTFTPQAGFTLTGTIDLLTVAANEDFVIDVAPPVFSQLEDMFDGTHEEDAAIEEAAKAALRRVRTDLTAGRNRIRAVVGQLLQSTFSRVILNGSDATLLTPDLRQRNNGSIQAEPTGLLEDLRLAMLDNTGGSGVIKVGPQAPTSASVSYPGAWAGAAATATLNDLARPGSIQGTCVKGLDATPPRFRLILTPTDIRKKTGAQFTGLLPAEFELVIGQPFRSHVLGIAALTINYLAAPANESGTTISTTPGDWSVTGLTSSNSDNGRLWGEYVGASDEIKFYLSESARDAQDSSGLVASVTGITNGAAFTATGDDDSLTVTGEADTKSDGDQFNVDFDPPQATQPFSYFTVAVTPTSDPGLFQQLVRDGLAANTRWYLHSAATPNVVDDQVLGGMLPGGRLFGDLLF